MRVDDERVGELDAVLRPALLVADPRRARVRGVDVQPRARRVRSAPRARAPGSTDANDVVPTVATTAATSSSSSTSARMRSSSSTGTLRSSIPSMRAAFSTDECACSEQTTTLRPVTWRAAISAASVDVDAVSSMWPCQPSGRPSSCRTQSTVRSSSSVDAGDARQRSATWFSVAASSSARIPGSDAGDREVREEARVLPVRERRDDQLVEVAQHVRERLALLGRRLAAAARESSPGSTCASTGSSPTPLEVVAPPSRRPRGRPSRKRHGRFRAACRPASTCACSRRRPSSASRGAPARSRARRSPARAI